MTIGQKDAVVAAVKAHLPTFTPYKDIALAMLPLKDLEEIKKSIAMCIEAGTVTYSKDPTNRAEVATYARSMVMNHLKKAKELNGNQVYGELTGASTPRAAKVPKALIGINQDLLTPELKEFIVSLV
jgi:hypothetical protein